MKNLALFLCLSVLSLSGCSSDDSSPVSEPTPPAGQQTKLIIEHEYMPLHHEINVGYNTDIGGWLNLQSIGSVMGSKRYEINYPNKIKVVDGKRFVLIQSENSIIEIELSLNGQVLVQQLEKLKQYKLFLSTGTDNVTMESLELIN